MEEVHNVLGPAVAVVAGRVEDNNFAGVLRAAAHIGVALIMSARQIAMPQSP